MLSWHNEDFGRSFAASDGYPRRALMDPVPLSSADRLLAGRRPRPARARRARRRRRGRSPCRRRPRPPLDDAERRRGRRPDARQPRRRGLRPGALQAQALGDARPGAAPRTSSRRRARRPTTWPGPQQRLDELGARPSLLNPLWYAGAFGIGLVAGRARRPRQPGLRRRDRAPGRAAPGTATSSACPPATSASRAIVAQMKDDEARHAGAGAGRPAPRDCRRRCAGRCAPPPR